MGTQKNPKITDNNTFLKTLNSEISTAESEVTHINPHSKLSFQLKKNSHQIYHKAVFKNDPCILLGKYFVAEG